MLFFFHSENLIIFECVSPAGIYGCHDSFSWFSSIHFSCVPMMRKHTLSKSTRKSSNDKSEWNLVGSLCFIQIYIWYSVCATAEAVSFLHLAKVLLVWISSLYQDHHCLVGNLGIVEDEQWCWWWSASGAILHRSGWYPSRIEAAGTRCRSNDTLEAGCFLSKMITWLDANPTLRLDWQHRLGLSSGCCCAAVFGTLSILRDGFTPILMEMLSVGLLERMVIVTVTNNLITRRLEEPKDWKLYV